MKDKKGQLGAVIIMFIIGMAVLLIMYTTTSGAVQKIKEEFNSSSYTADEQNTISNIDRAWKWAFIVLGGSLVVWVVLSALLNQPKHYDL